ncbi:MAG: alkaline phosphatase family protein [Myxococcota bacterium]
MSIHPTQTVDRVLVIGLDCAQPDLLFHRWADHLPYLTACAAAGTHGPLRSCHPPITVPAWRIMASGLHAGHQGVYGFRNRTPGAPYDTITLAHADAFQAPPVWDDLGANGLRSTLLGLPGTWPPQPLQGKMVTGPLTPNHEAAFTWPPSLRHRVLDLTPHYTFDIPNFRHLDPYELIDQVTAMTRDRFTVARALAAEDDWNLFWMVEIGLDRLYHALWHHIDTHHPRHQPNPTLSQALLDYHILLDREIEALVTLCDDGDTTTLIVSDHGARAMQGGLCLNVWLQRHGFQTLKPDVPDSCRFDARHIDWSRTQAWAWGGYCGRIFLNLQGREPEGIVPAQRRDALLTELTERLACIPGPDGRMLTNAVHRPEELYPDTCRGLPPDLTVYIDHLNWRAIDAITPDQLYTTDNDTGPDAANHDWDGVCIAFGPGIAPQGYTSGLRLEEVACWIRQLLMDSTGG